MDSKKILGYGAGIAAGIAYGLNPLFGKPLLASGVPVSVVLLFRYLIAGAILLPILIYKKEKIKVTSHQIPLLLALGCLFSASSISLFESYNFIPTGIATTIIFLYPVIVALVMIIFKNYPSWQVWLAIILSCIGVICFCQPPENANYNPLGFVLAFISALSYALFIVVLNRSKRVNALPSIIVTFYSLVVGSFVFVLYGLIRGLTPLPTLEQWPNVLGLSLFPTLVSMFGLTVSTRNVGPTKASVLGAMEPVTAILIGVLVFKEQLTTPIILGLFLTIFAIAFMSYSEHSRRKQN